MPDGHPSYSPRAERTTLMIYGELIEIILAGILLYSLLMVLGEIVHRSWLDVPTVSKRCRLFHVSPLTRKFVMARLTKTRRNKSIGVHSKARSKARTMGSLWFNLPKITSLESHTIHACLLIPSGILAGLTLMGSGLYKVSLVESFESSDIIKVKGKDWNTILSILRNTPTTMVLTGRHTISRSRNIPRTQKELTLLEGLESTSA